MVQEDEKDYDLDALLEKEKDPEKRRVLEYLKDAMLSKDGKKAKVIKELEEIDKKLKTGLTLILNFFAENGQFNQTLLEDVAVLIIKRSKVVKKIK
jgi:hypothetical protein